MKIALPFLVLALLTVVNAKAQVVSVQLTSEQDQYLPGESMPVTVRIINNSGQTLHLGESPNWLTFIVDSKDNDSVVVQKGNPPVQGGFDVGSSQMAIKHMDLAPYFMLRKAGRYTISAKVHISEWGTDSTSQPKEIDVIDGAEIWSQQFGMPMPAGVTNRPPEVRKYTLEEANYLRNQLRMYVLVSDASGSDVLRVNAIGPMVSFSQPEAQLDRESFLHVVYQSSARSFIYSVISPDGEITQQEIYDYVNTRPHLALDTNGDIVEAGGEPRVRQVDIPIVRAPDELPQMPAQPKQ
jgi:hypothetical protein